MRPNIILPNKAGTGENETISGVVNMVIIGANGAGKTRMGSWIEYNQPDNILVHRISAQRALILPENAEMKTLSAAKNALLYGHENALSVGDKMGNRWHHNANTSMLTDYDKLLAVLFAKIAKRNNDHIVLQKQTQDLIPIPDSPIDIITNAWQDIMPHNSILFEDGKVIVSRVGYEGIYHGKEMSDGERVALYLLGQCLCAEDNSIVIIDEPEIHLHKSLMGRLWNKIEELCPTKLLVYITHDLDFATSRKDAHKFWIKSYGGNGNWIWDNVPIIDELPENLVLEIVGNRKNIIFCEGDKGSYDYIIYQTVFPEYHIIPVGGCEKVIESTKAFSGNENLHHLNAVGIIDGDYRTVAEIAALRLANIYTINVAEIENLFCIEPILRIVAQNQLQNPNTKVEEVTAYIINALTGEFETQVTNHAEREIQFQLNSYVKLASSQKGLEDGFTALQARIDIPQIYTQSRALFQQAIDTNNLSLALQLYNRKKLPERISPIFGFVNGEYVNIVLRLLKSQEKGNIIAALRAYMPALI